MKIVKRICGKDGVGSRTSWEKGKNNFCVYCGEIAHTREHAPSKAFLLEPYEDLPTLPSCFNCNNGFSEDEKYVACFMYLLKSKVVDGYVMPGKVCEWIENDKKLKELSRQCINIDGVVHYTFNEQKLARIIFKLSRCHAAYELDFLNCDKASISYDIVYDLSPSVRNKFNSVQVLNIIPELGSRGNLIIQNVETGDVGFLVDWRVVQDGQYRYKVMLDGDACIVKIVFLEFLYCEVILNAKV